MSKETCKFRERYFISPSGRTAIKFVPALVGPNPPVAVRRYKAVLTYREEEMRSVIPLISDWKPVTRTEFLGWWGDASSNV